MGSTTLPFAILFPKHCCPLCQFLCLRLFCQPLCRAHFLDHPLCQPPFLAILSTGNRIVYSRYQPPFLPLLFSAFTSTRSHPFLPPCSAFLSAACPTTGFFTNSLTPVPTSSSDYPLAGILYKLSHYAFCLHSLPAASHLLLHSPLSLPVSSHMHHLSVPLHYCHTHIPM